MTKGVPYDAERLFLFSLKIPFFQQYDSIENFYLCPIWRSLNYTY